jgi:excisionase family DNA binding protein
LSISVEIPRAPAGLVSIAAAARALGVNRSTIWRLCQRGRLATHRSDGRLLISSSDAAHLLRRLPQSQRGGGRRR